MRNTSRKANLTNCDMSTGKTHLPTTEETLGLASRMATTNILHAYHPLQHYNLGSQISAYGENVDQP